MTDMPKRVEQLNGFPFESFNEFKQKYDSGDVNIGVDRGIALQWAQSDYHCPRYLPYLIAVLTWIPVITIIAYTVYLLVTKSWLYLLTLPILAIGYLLFHPSAGALVLLRKLQKTIILAVVAGMIWAIYVRDTNLIALCATLLTIKIFHFLVYTTAVRKYIEAIPKNEELFCTAWYGQSIYLVLQDGAKYWPPKASADLVSRSLEYNPPSDGANFRKRAK